MLKNDYNKFVKDVREVLTRFDKAITEEKNNTGMGGYMFHIDTPYGKLRVTIWDFVPRQKHIWLFTRIENPECVHDRIKNKPHFNKFSGKYNNFDSDADYLVRWLEDYLCELFRVIDNIKDMTDADFVHMMSVCHRVDSCSKCGYYRAEKCTGNPKRMISKEAVVCG